MLIAGVMARLARKQGLSDREIAQLYPSVVRVLTDAGKWPLAIANGEARKEPEPMPQRSKEQNQIVDALKELGGAQFQQSDITFEGTRLIIPEKMSPKQAIATIDAYNEAQEEYSIFHRDYRYRPWDGAAAVERALRTLTGGPGVARGTAGFFGTNPPQRIDIATGPNETMSVPWGNIYVPLFHDRADQEEPLLALGSINDPDYGTLFRLSFKVAKKYESAVMGFFELVQRELESNSIYRGKAFTGGDEPEFLDLSWIDPSKIIYSDDTMEQLNAHLFGMIKYADSMRDNGIPLKRSVLLYGPYGTGKTLGLMLTAREAANHGHTFILCRPGKDDPFKVIQTAQLYKPAVVGIEDIDTYSRSHGMSLDDMSLLLDRFDGIEAKNNDIMVAMTTNHHESITKGMLRPGRLDALIEIAHLDRGGVERMVRSLVDDSMLDNVDFDAVFDACHGYLPAFVAEAVTRAKNASIVRGEGTLLPLTTADLRNGAMSLRPQFDLMERASEVEIPPTLDTVFSDTVRQAMNDYGVTLNDGVEGYLVND